MGAQVTLQNPYELIDEYTEAELSSPSFFEPEPVMAPTTPEQKSRVSSSNFWMGSGSSSSGGVRLIGIEEETTESLRATGESLRATGEEDGKIKRTENALKKLKTDMIGTTVGGAPNVYTQTSSPFKIPTTVTDREDELSEARQDLEATTERPPSTRGTRDGDFFLLPLYNFFSE